MIKQKHTTKHTHSQGFTLVEMLVSVTLILLMMTMFATVFSIATGSVSTQRANSENDQKARALVTILRADFAKRTFRYMQPFAPGEDSSSPTPFGNRRGYFYVSTNSAPCGFDDIIQWTISSTETAESTDDTAYFGLARQLLDRDVSMTATAAASLSGSPNQPEIDDGELRANATGSSSAAEVCYFIRNGNLLRRQLLIREPIAVAGRDLDPQPQSFAGHDYFSGVTDVSDIPGSFDGGFQLVGAAGPTDDVYANFDYSVYPNLRRLDPVDETTIDFTTSFVGISALSNENSSASILASSDSGPLVSLGKPVYRFGFDFFDGLSREHVNGGAFMGRLLHAETSAPNFNWPQRNAHGETNTTIIGNGNPFDIDGTTLSLDPQSGLIEQFDDVTSSGSNRGGTRAQEDLILANVHEFRVELWDERAGRFVTPGYGAYDTSISPPTITGIDGDFHIARNLNSAFGADNVGGGTVFDTWHPDNTHNAQPRIDYRDNVTPDIQPNPHANAPPPYQMYDQYYPPELPDGPSNVGTGSGVGYWQPGTAYSVNDVVFPSSSQIIFDHPTLGTVGQFDPGIDRIIGQGFQLAYRCVAVDELDSDTTTNTPGTSGATPPNWPTTPGRRFSEGEEGNDEVTWQCIDNRRALKAVRITIRFLNEKSNDIRQLSLVLSLVDN